MRQWPGNWGDLDFRGVIRGCAALVAASAPIPGTLTGEFMSDLRDRSAFVKSAEYAEVVNRLAFCRLWCIGAYISIANSLPRTQPPSSIH